MKASSKTTCITGQEPTHFQMEQSTSDHSMKTSTFEAEVFSVSSDLIRYEVNMKFTQHGRMFPLLPLKVAVANWDCRSQLYPSHQISQKPGIWSQSTVSRWLLQTATCFCVTSLGRVKRNRIFQAPFRVFSSCLPTDTCRNTAQFCTDSLWRFFLLIFEVKYKFHRDEKKAELYFCHSEWSILVPLLLNINWANLNKGVLNCKDTISFPKTRNLSPLHNPQNRFNEKNNCRNSHENVHVYSPWLTSPSNLLGLI